MRRPMIGLMVSVLTTAANSVSAQNLLPPCPGSFPNRAWTDCVGKNTYPKGGSNYVGEYKDGKPDGQGTHTWLNGSKYVGEFKEGKRNGQGTFTWPSGDRYVGEYRDGMRNGQGTIYGADGSVVRSGTWENGAFVGGQ